MRKKVKSIPVNSLMAEPGSGISIERIIIKGPELADQAALDSFEEGNHSHRHDGHSFFMLENGTITVEIDFQTYIITAPSVIYVHPDQVHRIVSLENITVSSWGVTRENLNPEYLKLLEEISPAKPLLLTEETFSILREAVSLCIKLTRRKSDKLYHSLLKDSCNALVALVISQYLALCKPAEKSSRSELVTKAFRELLERNYTKFKGPAIYARHLNISASYLNECIKSTTGFSVSYHLQQRVILEAKRLLYHSNRSVKEIAATLGYHDYPYFSRLFSKATGMSALTFRNKTLE